ncbi:MAG TPA: apolipoprotein N-acyltransferase [Planctomycetaceae bacterium]|nr:apolipoprotein N-acyltransferase [Planctomycetaceae bacterium]
MSASLMSPPPVNQVQSRPAAPAADRDARRTAERTVEQIIDRARSRPARPPARGAWLLSGLTAVLLWASFTPLDWAPLGFAALVPLILLVRLPQPTAWMYRAVYVTGLAGTLAMLQWMRLGHPMMYLALLALSLYMAAYFPVFVGLCRAAVHRLSVPLTLAVPVVWVALEYARAHLMTGFAWYFLGHTQYRWIELIQISDVTGAYGVSFLLAMSAGCLAGLVSVRVLEKFRLLSPEDLSRCPALVSSRFRQAASVAAVLALFAAALAYGYLRRSQADFSSHPGPRVALVQGNFTAQVKHDPRMADEIQRMHYHLTGEAVRHQPDVIVWPETMYRNTLLDVGRGATASELDQFWNMATEGRAARDTAEIRASLIERNRLVEEMLTELAQQAGAAMIVGLDRFSLRGAGIRHYNSAAFITPDLGVADVYDKRHRVVFGEYVPLRDALPFLKHFTPFSPAAGIDAGERVAVFEHRGWRFAPMICFEDTVPHVVRQMARPPRRTDFHSVQHGATAGAAETDGVELRPAERDSRPVDVLVNLTNDGWFHGSSELDQHLITAAFRAVECRTPLVRAVNTGISAVIDGDGVIREPDVFIDADHHGRRSMRDPKSGRFHKQLNAVLVADVPLDRRSSLYVSWGDWFAGGCGGLTVAILVGAIVAARRRKAIDRGSVQSV